MGAERRRRMPPYLGLLSLIALAAVTIIASTLVFGYTARKAADETTASLSRFYLEEIADRNVSDFFVISIRVHGRHWLYC